MNIWSGKIKPGPEKRALPRFTVLAGLVLVLASPADAMFVEGTRSIEDMAENAELVVKATAISTVQADGSVPGNGPNIAHFETKLRVVSILKGSVGADVITFLHSDTHNNQVGAPQDVEDAGRMEVMAEMGIRPAHYEFVPGRSYILFARSRDRRKGGSLFEALWFGPVEGVDLSVLLAADSEPINVKSIKDACWQDLTGCCASTNVDDVIYGLEMLDQSSRGKSIMGSSIFSQEDVVDILRPLLTNQSARISQAAFELAGSHGPYTDDFLNAAASWMASPKGRAPGWSPDERFTNYAGRLLWQNLVTIAESNASADTRARAIRALGRTDVPELPALSERWAADPQPLVRQAAVLVLAEYPDIRSQNIIKRAAGDAAPEVREGAALAVGFAKIGSIAPRLGELLSDASPDVREAAAVSLLSMPLTDTREILRLHKSDTNYGCLFINALARNEVALYIEDMRRIIREDPTPHYWWGDRGSAFELGRIPARESWDILFGYLRAQPAEELKNRKFDPVFDALEELRRHSVVEPGSLRGFYKDHGLTNRTDELRQATRPIFSTTNTFWSGFFAM